MGSVLSLPPPLAIYSAARSNRAEDIKAVILGAYGGVPEENCLEWSDEDGYTALTIAIRKGHIACVDLLLDLGADCHRNVGQSGGGTALHVAMERREPNLYILSNLLKKGANPFAENCSGATAWEMAASRGLASICRTFEKKKGLFAHRLRVAVRDGEDDAAPDRRRWISVLPRYGSSYRGNADACTSTALYLFQSDKMAVHRFRLDLSRLNSPLVVKSKTGWNVMLGPRDRNTLIGARIPILDFFFESDRNSKKLLDAFLKAVQTGQGSVGSPTAPNRNSSTMRARLCRRLSSSQLERRTTRSEPAVRSKPSSASRRRRHGHSRSCALDEDPFLNCTIFPSCTPGREEGGKNKVQHSGKRGLSADTISITKRPADDSVCVICLENRPTAGFVHGTSVHRCVCEHCIEPFRNSDTPSCPVCRQKIEHIITDFF